MEEAASEKKLNKNKRIVYRGALVALAMVLSYLESFIPVFVAVPGVRIGLANIVTVFALFKLGLLDALSIGIIRTILSALLFGNPVMIIYSLAGVVLSVFAMFLAKNIPFFGRTGVSIVGGIFHNLGQMIAASFFIGNERLLYYLGILLAIGAVTGAVVGLISGIIIEKTE
ncbi:heptaprenyl diphosphate synthase [Eubacterium ruminantium]|nr:heptaprenyl diphosphate synthase [Eubacterium ruminantium]